MLQFYFLSILTNAAAGALLSADYFGRRLARLAWLSAHPGSRRLKLTCGAAALIVGACTIFWPAGSGVPVIGDLVPSIAGLAMGVALLFEVFRQDALFPSEPAPAPARAGLDWRSMIGIAGLAVAILHFFLPERPFL
ncbi:MAG: hypothetical protein NTU62_18155 [Spirochaetes bacterium]|nr:hypothetical protein [Spirochaetota bacterium]